MQQMLNGKLKIGDIEDVEKHCSIAIASYCKNRNIVLSPEDREDLMSFCMGLVWELYEAEDNNTTGKKWNGKGTFSGYVSYILPKRITDHYRKRWGRYGERYSVDQATPFSAMGTINASEQIHDQADSRADLGRFLSKL